MDTRHLQYILTIAQKQNMTKAAEELFISQSSLSQYLAKLEQEIGVPLFERTRSKMLLTPAGELYVEAARQVLSIEKHLYENIRSLNNRSHITLGLTSQLCLRMLTAIVPGFKTDFPDATLEITEANVKTLTHMLQEESLDCAVMAVHDTSAFAPDQVDILGTEEILLAIPKGHPYCKKNPGDTVPWNDLQEDLGQDNFLICKKGSTLREVTDQIFAAIHLDPSTMCETNSIITTRTMVAMGIGITFIGKSCMQDENKIHYYRLDPPVTRRFALIRRKNWVMHTPETTLCEEIRKYFKRKTVKALMR
ncbi:DNA-binding transcriptional regulator, LysR family [Acidaminococcus fermentans]|uniref:DNA-binding transcriptional regulator, LysR family n=1 Tax=Acidaminococcus fermentans TaxID=905 RepID=A0A1H2WTN4_ACIFE|nr:LysR family transcriptional regulator [Acidaminococcus fermentans]SDW83907.1 DNA-binding transcriptional regulator, LysR family [Acidaminococcus fermentans]